MDDLRSQSAQQSDDNININLFGYQEADNRFPMDASFSSKSSFKSTYNSKIYLKGLDMTTTDRSSYFAYVGQDNDLFRDLNIAENIAYSGLCYQDLNSPDTDAVISSLFTTSQSRLSLATNLSESMTDILAKGNTLTRSTYNSGQDLSGANYSPLPESKYYSKESRELKALKNSIVDAALIQTILNLQNGLKTKVGGRGRLLSGGERQRICIARALYREELTKSILLLDEATSQLDSLTENNIMNALYDRVHNHETTLILIAHRLTSLQRCNKILVMKDGVIVDSGTHDELVNKENSWYAEAWKLQHENLSSQSAYFVSPISSGTTSPVLSPFTSVVANLDNRIVNE